ncbi:MAG: UDP-2,3-diacylglucosamine diphosphatase [Methylococcaceae bacterium]
MKQTIFFISDIHLSLEKPAITKRFLDFLQYRAIHAHSIYILGDLFDVWVGDDDNTVFVNKIRQHLKQLTDTGVNVYLQVGNRDFLLGQKFCEQTGIVLLEDYTVIDLFGTLTLITHGDLLCTDDIAYQSFRVKARSETWQASVLAKPLLLRLLVARWYRVRSFFHKRKKNQAIMDVNQQTVLAVMREHHCSRLIHGHTHRPDVHSFDLDGLSAQRFVLAQWQKDGAELLSWQSQGYKIESI